MPREFKPVRFFVLMGVAAFVVCGVTAFYTHRALPSAAELNMMAQEYLEHQGAGDELRNLSPAGGLQARKQAFEKGYTDGFRKTHPQQ